MESQKVDKKKKQVDLSIFYQVVEGKRKRKEKELQKQKASVMEELFGEGPEIGQDDDEEIQEVQDTTSSEPIPKAKKLRKLRLAWKFEHKWAYPVVVEGRVRIKCEWCVYCKQKTPFANKGSCTLQLPSLNEHSVSDEHQLDAFKWANKEKRLCIPLPEYVATFEDKEKIRVITIMWQVYFVVKCAGPMELFEKLCLHQIEQGLPNMPRHVDYGTYLNRAVGIEFVQAIKDVLWKALCGEIQATPWFSLMVDDSTDRGKEGYLIVYVSYLKNGGKGENHVTFVKLIKKTDDGGAEAKYDALINYLKEMGLSIHKLVSFATDGCSIMVGQRHGFIAKMRADVSHLLLVHCLAHRENLAVSQAVDSFPKLVHLDKLCRSIYTWLHASRKRMDDFKLIEGALNLPKLAMLRLVDIANISGFADAALQNLKKKFLRDSAGCGTKYLKHFVQQTKGGQITFSDAGGDIHVHMLNFDKIEGSNRGGSLEDCMHLGKELVIKVVENLTTKMQEDMPIFEACKLFSQKHYSDEELLREACSKQWLLQVLRQYGSLVESVEKCMGELDSFTTVFPSNVKHKRFRDAWEVLPNLTCLDGRAISSFAVRMTFLKLCCHSCDTFNASRRVDGHPILSLAVLLMFACAQAAAFSDSLAMKRIKQQQGEVSCLTKWCPL
ncbi:hypothetical protein L7F22_010966 [Adiantum nelumboides]|nr:hypothetical protein [Adiantum nelumboides]